MPVVSDFTTILGDEVKVIGPGNPAEEFKFDTGGRHAPGDAYIIMMVRGMTATTQNAQVRLNGELIGHILNNNGGHNNIWQTQIIHTRGAKLNNGENSLLLSDVSNNEYSVRDIFCHFKQDV